MERDAVAGELRRLRTSGLRGSHADDYPLLSELIVAHGVAESSGDFGGHVAELVGRSLAAHASHPYSRTVEEVFCLHSTTRGMSTRSAYEVSVRRVRGSTTPAEKDAFRNNELKKALVFLAELLVDVGTTSATQTEEEMEISIPRELVLGAHEAGLSRFFPSREHYKRFRGGLDSISEYVALADTCLEMISINLATGTDIEGVLDTFEDLIQRRKPVTVRISLLDPELPYLAQAIAPVVSAAPTTLIGRTSDTLDALAQLRDVRLGKARRKYLEVWCHSCVPNASAIIIDGDSAEGRVQLETKGYKVGMKHSFGFEVRAGTEFFARLRDSYRELISDGRQVL